MEYNHKSSVTFDKVEKIVHIDFEKQTKVASHFIWNMSCNVPVEYSEIVSYVCYNVNCVNLMYYFKSFG